MNNISTARGLLLGFIDEVMEELVPAHEALCDEGKCSIEEPCVFCKVGEIMMKNLTKYS